MAQQINTYDMKIAPQIVSALFQHNVSSTNIARRYRWTLSPQRSHFLQNIFEFSVEVTATEVSSLTYMVLVDSG